VKYLDPDGQFQTDSQKELNKQLSDLAASSPNVQQLIKETATIEIYRTILDNGNNGHFYQSTAIVKVLGYELNMVSVQSTADHSQLNKDKAHQGHTLVAGIYVGTLINKSGKYLNAISITGNGVEASEGFLVHPNVFTARGETKPYNSDGKPSSLGCQIMYLENFDEVIDILDSLGIECGHSYKGKEWQEGDKIKIEIFDPIKEYN
jgi:hypothetical protein